jgi:hypothetical protein
MGSKLSTGEGMEFDNESFTTLGQLTHINSIVVPVVVVDSNQIQCIGSAFNISPEGLWITAKHVVDFAAKLVAERPGASIGVLWVGSGEEEDDVPDLLGGYIHAPYITKDDQNGSDLGMLRAGLIKAGVPYEFPFCRLSARVPKTGTHVLAMGYARFSVDSDTSKDDLREIVIQPNFSISTGEILQVFKTGRDTFRDLDGNYTGRLPTVCFETSARFDPGMSGGPVLDENSWVCGIIATGLESDDVASDRSFASGTPYVFTLGLIAEGQTMRVYEMVERELVECDAWFETLVVTEQDGLLDLSYACEREDSTES